MKVGIERHTVVKARDLSGSVVRSKDESYIYVSRWFGLWKRYVRFGDWGAAYRDTFVYVKLVKRASLATPLPFKDAQNIESYMRYLPEKYIVEY